MSALIKPSLSSLDALSSSKSVPLHALVVAAGRGQRFGGHIAKQYTQVAGQTVLQHSVSCLGKSAFINAVTIVVAVDDTHIDSLNFDIPIKLAIGGAERWQSVQAGIESIVEAGGDEDDLVLIHDAARPCISSECIDRVVKVASQEKYGAILGMPVTDTLKQVSSAPTVSNIENEEVKRLAKMASDNNSRQVIKTIDRRQLWQAQTPQVFRLGKLIEVLGYVATRGLEITDEASAFELLNYPIKIVEGNRLNIKLTYPDDIQLLNAILTMR